eukprot:3492273-Prymnesium_polylepis.1
MASPMPTSYVRTFTESPGSTAVAEDISAPSSVRQKVIDRMPRHRRQKLPQDDSEMELTSTSCA